MQKQDEEESWIITTFLAKNIKTTTYLKHQSHYHLNTLLITSSLFIESMGKHTYLGKGHAQLGNKGSDYIVYT
jgi:hypothetical protein